MKTKFIITAGIALCALTFTACNNRAKQIKNDLDSSTPAATTTTAKKAPKGDYYTCKMHPEIHMDKPGTCPKCGMTLVKVDSKGNPVAADSTKTMKM